MGEKLCVSYDAVQRYFAFRQRVNAVALEDIEWVRDDGSVIVVDPALIEDWRFIGLTNFCFAESYLPEVVEGRGAELLKDIRTFDGCGHSGDDFGGSPGEVTGDQGGGPLVGGSEGG